MPHWIHFIIQFVLLLSFSRVPLPIKPNFFQEYLKMDEDNVRENFIRNFFPSEHSFDWDIEWTESELELQEIILNKLVSFILPITIKLQSTMDKENKIKKAATILATKFITTTIHTANMKLLQLQLKKFWQAIQIQIWSSKS